VSKAWTPHAGDVLWLYFDPQSGHEQAGRRPGLVVSATAFNRQSGLALICPITSKKKGFRFEVPLPPEGKIQGSVLAYQVKCCDWASRNGTKAGSVTPEILEQVRQVIGLMLEFP
jgi:mRNA interferase MazF